MGLLMRFSKAQCAGTSLELGQPLLGWLVEPGEQHDSGWLCQPCCVWLLLLL